MQGADAIAVKSQVLDGTTSQLTAEGAKLLQKANVQLDDLKHQACEAAVSTCAEGMEINFKQAVAWLKVAFSIEQDRQSELQQASLLDKLESQAAVQHNTETDSEFESLTEETKALCTEKQDSAGQGSPRKSQQG